MSCHFYKSLKRNIYLGCRCVCKTDITHLRCFNFNYGHNNVNFSIIVANRFVEDYGVLRLSMGEAIRFVLDKQSTSALAKEINEYLYIGQTVPDALGIQALENALLNVTCQTRG